MSPDATGAAAEVPVVELSRSRYRRVVAATSIGTFIEMYDAVLYGYFATVLAAQFFPTEDPTAGLLATFAIFAVGFLVNPVGAVVFGHVGDRVGRKSSLAASLLLMTVATVAFGVLPTYEQVGLLAPVLLLVCRLLQGLSVSGEIPGSQLLTTEYAPEGRRGRTLAVNNVAGTLGGAAAATVGLVLARTLPPDDLAGWGWRVAFLAAAPIGLVGLYLRTRLLDSPAFVALGELAKQGHAPLAQAVRSARRGMLVLLVFTAGSALGGFLLAGFLPSYLIQVAGLSTVDAFTANLVALLVQAISTVGGGFLADRYPLRRVAIVVTAGIAVTVVPGFWIIIHWHNLTAALIGQSIWAIFLGATYTVSTLMAMVLFPVAIRFTALAVSFNIGMTVFGSTAPYASTWLVQSTGSPLAPSFYLAAAAVAGLVAVTIGLRPGTAPESGPTDGGDVVLTPPAPSAQGVSPRPPSSRAPSPRGPSNGASVTEVPSPQAPSQQA
jgi:MHS family proline/betaine transporter-like MFS transporter